MTTPFCLQKTDTSLDLSSMFFGQKLFFYPYGRYAFFSLLHSLGISSIYMPSFICRDMLSPIFTLDIQCFFYEIDQDFKPIALDKKCDAILFVNYFGFATDIAPFKEYQQKHRAILIEDNAHGFLSKDTEGHWLGTRGDFGIFSLRKTLALPNGAMLSVNNPKFFSQVFQEARICTTDEDKKYFQKQKLKAFSPKLAFMLMRLRGYWRAFKTGTHIPQEDPSNETSLPHNSCLTPVLAQKYLSLDIHDEIQRRIDMFAKVAEWANDFHITPCFELYDGCSPYVFPFFDSTNCKNFEKYLLQHHFFVLPWPSLPSNIKNMPTWYSSIKVVPFLW